MDVNTLRIAATLASLLTFVGIWAWAWRRANAARFDEAAQLPFVDDDATTTDNPTLRMPT